MLSGLMSVVAHRPSITFVATVFRKCPVPSDGEQDVRLQRVPRPTTLLAFSLRCRSVRLDIEIRLGKMYEENMIDQPVTWVSTNDSNPAGKPSRANPSDTEVLDAYSQAVVNVVDCVAPAVISITGEGSGSGSGFVLSTDGYAITNSHVVGNRRKLTAETNEGDRVEAEVIGNDPATDVALMRLASSDLPYCEPWRFGGHPSGSAGHRYG